MLRSRIVQSGLHDRRRPPDATEVAGAQPPPVVTGNPRAVAGSARHARVSNARGVRQSETLIGNKPTTARGKPLAWDHTGDPHHTHDSRFWESPSSADFDLCLPKTSPSLIAQDLRASRFPVRSATPPPHRPRTERITRASCALSPLCSARAFSHMRSSPRRSWLFATSSASSCTVMASGSTGGGSRAKPGRSRIDTEIRSLIRCMSREDAMWVASDSI